jgi:hypothetical protein
MPGPFAIGLMVGTAAFGIAKLAGASTRTALLAGGLAGLGAGGLNALMAAPTATKVGAVTQGLGSVAGTGSTAAATNAAALQASMGGGQSAILGAGGTPTAFGGALGAGSTIPLGTTASALGSTAATAPSFMTTGLEAGKDAFMAAQGNVAGPIALGPEAYGVAPEQVGLTGSVSRPDLTVAPTSITDKIVNFAKENPLTTAGAVLTGGKMISDLTAQQPIYDDSTAQPYTEQEYTDAYNRQRAAMQGIGERASYTMADDALTPANVYERQEEMFAAREGGLATLKLKEGGINYLPSKSDHDEKDANNYVRAMGYVEDGAGNGDKDEDTMLAQLADGEFVSRADAILGAGIMSGANPDDFKDMRRKGAQFFYKQQDSLKRVYDLVSDGNKAS